MIPETCLLIDLVPWVSILHKTSMMHIHCVDVARFFQGAHGGPLVVRVRSRPRRAAFAKMEFRRKMPEGFATAGVASRSHRPESQPTA